MDSLNVTFIHRLYDYSYLPEDTFAQRLKKLQLIEGISQYYLSKFTNILKRMISSYECNSVYHNLDSLKKLSSVFDIKDGYTNFLIKYDKL